uniref:Cul o 5 allergen n=1 Tax=Culicoides obsoletus TaxID=289301 RepID=M4WK63_CULOB|nr:Cul o 5 allergen [Culicoides obsoletus]
MKRVILGGIILFLTSKFVLSFDLSDALPGHITDDMTTTEKPTNVAAATADFSDDDLLAVINESKKKVKSSDVKPTNKLLTNVKNKLESVDFKKIDQKVASLLIPIYKKASEAILNWISMTGAAIETSPCFEKIDRIFTKILQDTSKYFTPARANIAQKSYVEKLTKALSTIRQCIISKIKK